MADPTQIRVSEYRFSVEREWRDGDLKGTFSANFGVHIPENPSAPSTRSPRPSCSIVHATGFPSRKAAFAWGQALLEAVESVLPEPTHQWHDWGDDA